MFADRTEAGIRLARALEKYKHTGVLVLAIPKGGLEVGYQVAGYLGADLAPIIARKLPLPQNPEAGFGAIAEDGSTFIFEHGRQWLAEEVIARIVEREKQEIARRIQTLRAGRPLPAIEGRTVILVDDGIAMGSTMRAAIMMCRRQGAGKVIVAAPVTGERVAADMANLADEVVILEKPRDFHAVAQVYENWYDVTDEESLQILAKCAHEKASGPGQ